MLFSDKRLLGSRDECNVKLLNPCVFRMNTDTKTVLLQTKANMHIVGDILIKLTKDSKTFSGIYTADASKRCFGPCFAGLTFGPTTHTHTFSHIENYVYYRFLL